MRKCKEIVLEWRNLLDGIMEKQVILRGQFYFIPQWLRVAPLRNPLKYMTKPYHNQKLDSDGFQGPYFLRSAIPIVDS